MHSTIKSQEHSKILAELSVPSKTFLLGEYLIMLGGPALLAATGPRFEMRVFESNVKTQNFHPDSPAGLLFKNQNTPNCFFEFKDPYQHSGGMGASSAQFVLAHAFLNSDLRNGTGGDWQNFYQKFRSQSAQENRYDRPSGGDVVAQFNGGISYFYPEQNLLEKTEWNFTDLEFSLFKTSQKIATHDHIKETNARLIEFKKSDLYKTSVDAIKQAFQALQKQDSNSFVNAFTAFAAVLNQLGFVSQMTQATLKQLKSRQEVLAAKGCGAMGADVICVLYKPQESIQEFASSLGLKYLCSSKQIESDGLRYD